MENRKARIALIGCGGIAIVHLPHILACKSLVLRAAADIDKQRLEGFVSQTRCQYTTTDVSQIFSDDEIDGVMICTSNDTHASLTLKALESGKHVFVEKPLALSSKDCRLIVRAAKKANRQVMVGYWYALHPAFQLIKSRICTPYIISARCAAGTSGQSFNPAKAFTETMEPLKGFGAGGSLLHQGCYLLFASTYLAGSEPVQLFAAAPDGDVYQNSLIILRFKSGTVAQVLNSNIGGGGLLKKWYFEVLGGTVNAALHNLTELSFRGLEPEVLNFDYHAGLKDQSALFASMILDSTEPPVDARKASVVNLLAEAAYYSITTKKPVDVEQMPF